MPMKQRRMNGRPSILRQLTMLDALNCFSSSMGVAASNEIERKLMTAYITNSARQPSPKVGNAVVAPHAAIIGARKEAMAFTNCPKVSVEASLSPDIRFVTNGFKEVCIIAFPIPSKGNERSIIM